MCPSTVFTRSSVQSLVLHVSKFDVAGQRTGPLYSDSLLPIILPCSRRIPSILSSHDACMCRAFQNGRGIAKAGAPEAMLAAMRDHVASGTAAPQIPTAVCSALRRIAVNDQICMDFADAGGVTVTMQVAYAVILNSDRI